MKTIASMYGTREVMEMILDYVRGDVLDFGAGVGKQKKLLMTNAKSYTAMDITPHESVDIVGDVLAPPIADNSYDTVISNQVIEHVRKPWVMVQQMARITRPGGTCIVTGPFMVPYHAHPNDFFRFTEEGMKTLCEDAGLQIVLCTKYGGWWAIVGELAKQRFFSPYRPQSRVRKLLGRWSEKTFRFFSKYCPPGIAYANTICIAKKP